MTQATQSTLRLDVETLFRWGTLGARSDAELLGTFLRCAGEEAESAFAVLVERHGGMVLRTCRSVLRNDAEAHDAFQATFLVLVRRAAWVRVETSLGPWLHAVALRTARAERRARAVRLHHEGRHAAVAPTAAPGPGWDDRAEVLYEEIGRLPGPMRAAVVACDLEGLTQEQAAGLLGWPLGTLQSRLARGRSRLRDRLSRRGLGAADRIGAVVLAGSARLAPEVVPATLAEMVRRTAVDLLAGGPSCRTGAVWELSNQVIGGMSMAKWKSLLVATGLLTVSSAGLTLGAALFAGGPPDAGPHPARKPPQAPADLPGAQTAEPGGPPASPFAVDRPVPPAGADVREVQPPPPLLPPPEGVFRVPATDPEKLRKVKVGDYLHLAVLEALPGRPVDMVAQVRPDGTVSLGFYGDLDVEGLNRTQVKEKLVERLRRFLPDEVLGLEDVDPATGKRSAISFSESNRVFVEDHVTPAAQESHRLARLEASVNQLTLLVRQLVAEKKQAPPTGR